MADRKKIVYPYIPNSAPEVQREMLASIGAESIDEFYECVPEPLRFTGKMNLPRALSGRVQSETSYGEDASQEPGNPGSPELPRRRLLAALRFPRSVTR